MDLRTRVQQEIEDLHAFFVEWFTGSCPNDDATFEIGFSARFGEGCRLIMPGGSCMPITKLAETMRQLHGSNPDFRIAIRNVEVVHRGDTTALVLYEEWQRHAKQSSPPDNGRRSTVLFAVPQREGQPLQWLHIHETWLPAEQMAGGPYDF